MGELLVWSQESSGKRTHGMRGGRCWGDHVSTVLPAPPKSENQDAGKGWKWPSQRIVAVRLMSD